MRNDLRHTLQGGPGGSLRCSGNISAAALLNRHRRLECPVAEGSRRAKARREGGNFREHSNPRYIYCVLLGWGCRTGRGRRSEFRRNRRELLVGLERSLLRTNLRILSGDLRRQLRARRVRFRDLRCDGCRALHDAGQQRRLLRSELVVLRRDQRRLLRGDRRDLTAGEQRGLLRGKLGILLGDLPGKRRTRCVRRHELRGGCRTSEVGGQQRRLLRIELRGLLRRLLRGKLRVCAANSAASTLFEVMSPVAIAACLSSNFASVRACCAVSWGFCAAICAARAATEAAARWTEPVRPTGARA